MIAELLQQNTLMVADNEKILNEAVSYVDSHTQTKGCSIDGAVDASVFAHFI